MKNTKGLEKEKILQKQFDAWQSVFFKYAHNYNNYRAIPWQEKIGFSYQISDLPFYSQIDHRFPMGNDEQLWLKQKETEFSLSGYASRLNKNHFLKGIAKQDYITWHDRICGLACCAMAITHLTGKSISCKELLPYKDIVNSYTDPKTGVEKSHTFYQEGVGRSHWGLIKIAQEYGLSGTVGFVSEDKKNDFIRTLVEYLNANKIVSLSVTPGFQQLDTRKGGHLVVLQGIDEQKHEMCFHDPFLRKSKIIISVQKFIDSFSGKYIVFYTP